MDFSLLTRLTEIPGVSGREEQVRAFVAEHLAELSANPRTDAMGNLVAHLPGDGPRVALIAHMDEVGFLVSRIDDQGFLRVMPMGGVDPQVFWAQRVVVHGRRDLPGVVGSVPPHLRQKESGREASGPLPIEEGYIDLGLPAEDVAALVTVGDPVTFATRGWENDHSIFAKALDDRVGLFAMLVAAGRAKRRNCDLYLIASCQEEVGLRGAGPAVEAVAPEIVLALEGTVAADMPGVKLPTNMAPTVQGKGPEIRLTDRGMIADRALADLLARIAEELNIPHQVIVKRIGATDATAAQIRAAGARAGALSVPVRYIHAPIGVARKSDIAHTVELITAFLEHASEAIT